jgi:type I restriction enzyme, S subunit
MQNPPLSPNSPWQLVPLSLCGELYCGQSSSVAEVNTDGRGQPYFTGPEQWDGTQLHVDKWTESPKRLVPDGCIFITVKGAGVGKLFPGMAGAIGRDIYAFRVHPQLEFKYIYYCLRHTIDSIVFQAKGDIPGLSRSHILEHQVLLPSASQQRRIVAKIEELFSELDKGVEYLTTARKKLNVFRLVVLHQSICDDRGFPYHTKPLDELIGPMQQGWSPKCDLNRAPDDGEWAIIKTTVVQPMAYLAGECKPFPVELKSRPDIEIHDGDILMTRKGPRPRTGVVCYVRRARPKSMLCDTVYRFRALEESIDPEYLELALNSPSVAQEIDTRKSGISESGISLNHARIRSLRVPVPEDKQLQRRIVLKARERLSVIEYNEALIDEQIQRITVIRQSILQQAFSGRLVAENPKDEPASVLLGRIRAEQNCAKTSPESNTQRIAGNGKKGRKKAA